MKVLVTGGTGFIGSAIARDFLARGHEVLVTGNCQDRVPKGVKFLPMNFTGVDWSQLNGVDLCFHEAANNLTTDMDERRMFNSNVYAPMQLFYGLVGCGCKKFVYASSTAVYGNAQAPYVETQDTTPINPYGASKAEFDRFAMRFGAEMKVDVVGLRYCNVYGPGEEHKGKRRSMIHQLIEKAMNDEPLQLFKFGEQKREWIYIKDVVKANVLASKYKGCSIFNCGTGSPIKFNEIVGHIKNKSRKNLKLTYIDCPNPVAYQSHVETNMRKAETLLGFRPGFSVEKGIEDMLS